MTYRFPIINNIADILPAIEGREEFVVYQRDGYKVVNYLYKTDETFPELTDHYSTILRELRGIAFNATDGRIIKRPLQKFFNLDERAESRQEQVDVERAHVILAKLDGSQVSPLLEPSSSRLIWTTKAGETAMTPDIRRHVMQQQALGRCYVQFALTCIKYGVTPIFEFCSRSNRVVIDYPETRLVLIAMRHMTTGFYYPMRVLEIHSRTYNLPLVEETLAVNWIDNRSKLFYLKRAIADQEETEGVVVRFDDGQMLKVKSDWYLKLHRAKDEIRSERKVVACIVNESIDDLIPALVIDADRQRVCRYYGEFCVAVDRFAYLTLAVIDCLQRHKIARKDFGRAQWMVPKLVAQIVFKFWEQPVGRLVVRQEILQKVGFTCSNMKNFAIVKAQVFPDIKYDYTAEEVDDE